MLASMPRDLPIGNGNLMINFDHEYNIRDVYYPHVGQANQTVGDVSFFAASSARRAVLRNQRSAPRRARLYIHFDPHLWGNNIGDTIFYDPDLSALVAYKGMRYVLMNASIGDAYGFHNFAIGAKERDGFQGTWREAEDGTVQRNAIAGSGEHTAEP